MGQYANCKHLRSRARSSFDSSCPKLSQKPSIFDLRSDSLSPELISLLKIPCLVVASVASGRVPESSRVYRAEAVDSDTVTSIRRLGRIPLIPVEAELVGSRALAIVNSNWTDCKGCTELSYPSEQGHLLASACPNPAQTFCEALRCDSQVGYESC